MHVRKYGDKSLAHQNQWMQHEEAERVPTGWQRRSRLKKKVLRLPTQRTEEGQISRRLGVHYRAHLVEPILFGRR